MLRNCSRFILLILAVMLAMSSANILAESIDETQNDQPQAAIEKATSEPPEEKQTTSAKEQSTAPERKAASVEEQSDPVEKQSPPAEGPSTSNEEQVTDAEELPTPEQDEIPPVGEQSDPAQQQPELDTPEQEESPEGDTAGDEQMQSGRSVTIRIHGEPGSFRIGDTVVLEAVLQGYEDVHYDVAWEYSADGIAWNAAPDESDQLKYTFIMDEETATWYWRVVVEPFQTIEDLGVPLGDGLSQGDDRSFVALCAASGMVLLFGCAIALVIRRRKGKKASN